jgi:hypothetical protein
MVGDGLWVQGVPHRLASCWHLPSLYASSPETTFGRLALKFLAAKASLVGLQGFITGELAEPWQDEGLGPKARRAEAVWIGSEPVPGGIRLMSVDVQALSPMFWIVVREWGDVGKSRLVFAGHCDQWEDVARISWRTSGGAPSHRRFQVQRAEVYQRCLGHSKAVPRVMAFLWWLAGCPQVEEGRLVWIDKDGRRPAPYFIGRAALPPHCASNSLWSNGTPNPCATSWGDFGRVKTGVRRGPWCRFRPASRSLVCGVSTRRHIICISSRGAGRHSRTPAGEGDEMGLTDAESRGSPSGLRAIADPRGNDPWQAQALDRG